MQDSLKQRLAEYLRIYAHLPSSEDSAQFFDIYRSLPTAIRPMFVDKVSCMQNPVVIDIASFYGEDFGLWVAQQNLSAEVHVYNPFTIDFFAPFLFNDLNKGIIAKLRPTTHFDKEDAEASINRLYRTNELRNITFHKRAVSQRDLEAIAEDYAGRQVVFVSLRTPTTPQEMTSQIAAAVGKHGNAQMVLAPYVNDDIRAYADDPLINVVNQNWERLLRGKDSEQYDLRISRDARLYVALSLYYACLSAERAGATVYYNNIPKGFLFQYPCCFVSTLRPG